jgi:FkbM family methyltransferase
MLIDLTTLVQKYNLKIKGIIHVGSHELEELPKYKENNVDNIIWIDGNPDLVNNARNNFPDEKIFHYLISDSDDKEVTFNISNNGQSSSILEMGTHKNYYPSIHYIDTKVLKTNKLSSIIINENIDINSFNFLNLDIQGVEYEALVGLEKYIDNIDYIYTEVNFQEVYINCKKVEEIDNLLNNFTRVETADSGAGWGDSFYIRK